MTWHNESEISDVAQCSLIVLDDVAQFLELPATDDARAAATRAERGRSSVALVAWDAGGSGEPERMKVREVT